MCLRQTAHNAARVQSKADATRFAVLSILRHATAFPDGQQPIRRKTPCNYLFVLCHPQAETNLFRAHTVLRDPDNGLQDWSSCATWHLP
jgi:hypothetical protein